MKLVFQIAGAIALAWLVLIEIPSWIEQRDYERCVGAGLASPWDDAGWRDAQCNRWRSDLLDRELATLR